MVSVRFGRPNRAPRVGAFAFPGRRPPRWTPAWAIVGASLRDACWGEDAQRERDDPSDFRGHWPGQPFFVGGGERQTAELGSCYPTLRHSAVRRDSRMGHLLTVVV